eukprot:9334398-Alexandrium_andersonii.AAC.1
MRATKSPLAPADPESDVSPEQRRYINSRAADIFMSLARQEINEEVALLAQCGSRTMSFEA